jgi:hypothetical protein
VAAGTYSIQFIIIGITFEYFDQRLRLVPVRWQGEKTKIERESLTARELATT